jgi:hypothetical protein
MTVPEPCIWLQIKGIHTKILLSTAMKSEKDRGSEKKKNKIKEMRKHIVVLPSGYILYVKL